MFIFFFPFVFLSFSRKEFLLLRTSFLRKYTSEAKRKKDTMDRRFLVRAEVLRIFGINEFDLRAPQTLASAECPPFLVDVDPPPGLKPRQLAHRVMVLVVGPRWQPASDP